MQPIKSQAVLGQQSRMSSTRALYIDRVTPVSLGLAGGDQQGCSTPVAVATAIKKDLAAR